MKPHRSFIFFFVAALLFAAFSIPAHSQGSWPQARGPFSLADNILNSTVIARSGGIYQIRAKNQEIFTPAMDLGWPIESAMTTNASVMPDQIGHLPTAASLPTPIGSPDPAFFSYLLQSRMYEDAAALLFTPGVFAPSDTLQYLRGLLAYDVHDFSKAAACFASAGTFKQDITLQYLSVWNSTPESPAFKPRSPFLAAAMSAVIPGTGKIYAGDLRSGISTLLVVGALAGMTAESWAKYGLKDWRTIALGSLFSIFHIGNIYGSALSVSVIKDTYSNAEKATLLFDLRIPLHEL